MINSRRKIEKKTPVIASLQSESGNLLNKARNLASGFRGKVLGIVGGLGMLTFVNCTKEPVPVDMPTQTEKVTTQNLANTITLNNSEIPTNLSPQVGEIIAIPKISGTALTGEVNIAELSINDPNNILKEVAGENSAKFYYFEVTGFGAVDITQKISSDAEKQNELNLDGGKTNNDIKNFSAENITRITAINNEALGSEARLNEIENADYFADQPLQVDFREFTDKQPVEFDVLEENFPLDIFSEKKSLRDENNQKIGLNLTPAGSYNKPFSITVNIIFEDGTNEIKTIHFRKGIQEDLSNSAAIEAVKRRAQHHFLQSGYNASMEDTYFDTVYQSAFTPLEEAPEIKLSLNGLDGEVKEGAIRFIDQLNIAMSITRPNQKFVIVENDPSASFRAGFGDANGNLGIAIVERENGAVVGSEIIVSEESSLSEINNIATFGQEFFNSLTDLGFDQSSERTSTNHLGLAQTDSYSFIDIYNAAVAFAFPKGVKVDQASAVYDRITSEKKYGPNKNQTILEVLIDMENARIDSIEAEPTNKASVVTKIDNKTTAFVLPTTNEKVAQMVFANT